MRLFKKSVSENGKYLNLNQIKMLLANHNVTAKGTDYCPTALRESRDSKALKQADRLWHSEILRLKMAANESETSGVQIPPPMPDRVVARAAEPCIFEAVIAANQAAARSVRFTILQW